MAKLIYGMGASVDGYIEDPGGGFDWSAPDEDLHAAANQQAREAAAQLYGRRLFELMEGYWPGAAARDDLSPVEADFARAYVQTPRYVFSDSLAAAPAGVRLVRSAEAVAVVEALKRDATGPLQLGGPGLAASLFDLIDEFQFWVTPVLVGGGKPLFPAGTGQVPLVLREQRTFASGTLFLRYERIHA